MAKEVGLPLFVSFAGHPINCRLVGHKSEKHHYTRLILKHGGFVTKTPNSPRLVLVIGDLPCNQGHSGCKKHPGFSSQPAFRISWVDHCISESAVFDVGRYLMNPTVEYARIDFMKQLMDGFYKVEPQIDESQQSSSIYLFLSKSTQNTENCSSHELRNEKVVKEHRSEIPPTKTSPTRQRPLENRQLFSGTPNLRNPPSFTSTPRVPKPVEKIHEKDEPTKRKIEANSREKPVFSKQKLSQSIRSSTEDTSSSSSDSESPPSPKRPKNVGSMNLPGPSTNSNHQVVTFDDSDNEIGDLDVRPKVPVSFDDVNTIQAPTGPKSSSSRIPPLVTRTQKVNPKETAASSDDDDDFFGPPPGSIVRQIGIRQNTRTPYTLAEEIAILRFIVARGKFSGLRSDVIWKEMDGKPGVERRTWQSLKEHFIKAMIPAIDKYGILTKEQIQEVRK